MSRPQPVRAETTGAKPASVSKPHKSPRRRNFFISHQYAAWHKMGITEKITKIRSGVPARLVGDISSVMDMSKEALIDALGLSRAVVNRKVQSKQLLSREESERVMGMQSLIGLVHSMVDADSVPEFDAAKWLARWLAKPLPALGGNTPASYMDTIEGQKYIGKLLAMTQSGAYA